MLHRSALNFRARTVMVGLLACLLFGAFKLSAQDEQVFKGQITPCVCTGQDAHAPAAANGVTSPLCTPACAEGGAKYLLSDFQHKVTYQFDNQDLPKSFASQYVFVIGILDRSSGTIHVHNVLPDLPPQIKRAKTVAVVCDACPRGMAKARRAAFEELTDWKRFTVAPDPKNADLIFLFSANRYRGDYVTRDGPDERPVHVDITYMNVVDPHTGVSLWGDSERLGSWFVGTATKDLISELREMMEEDVNPSERQSFIKRHHIPKAATDTGK